MIEARRIIGLTVTESDLKEISEAPLRRIKKLMEKVSKEVNATGIYIYGGALRNFVWMSLNKKIPREHKVDVDVLVTTPMAMSGIISKMGDLDEFSPLLIVSEDTLRANLGEGKYCDIKFTPSVRYAAVDFTINAVFAPLRDVFSDGAPVYCASLEDLENMVLKHIMPFEVYPFHLVRGIRLAATYNLSIHPTTLNAYRKSAKYVRDVSAPLVHRELAKAVNTGFERAVWFIAITNILLELFPSLKTWARKNPDAYTTHIQTAHNLISQFNPDKGDKEVLDIAPPKLLTKTFAPGDRTLLYCYMIAALTLPLDTNKLLERLIELNFYPAERGIILVCHEHAKGNTPLDKVPPLAAPFVLAYRKMS